MSASEEIAAARDDLQRVYEHLQEASAALPDSDEAREPLREWTRWLRAVEADMDRWLSGGERRT